MTSAPMSDGVTRPTKAPEAGRSSAVIRAAAENFVMAQRHTSADIAVFEELALQLLRGTPLLDRAEVSRVLAPHPDTPRTVLVALATDDPAVAAPVLAGAPKLDDLALLGLIAAGSREHRDLVARRPNLSDAVVEALYRVAGPDDIPPLLANPAVTLPARLVADVLALARSNPEIARALSRRTDIDDADLTDLFLDLDDRGRRRVLHALEILALREFAAGRPLPRAPRPESDVVAGLARAALSRDTPRIAGELASLAGIDETLAVRILDDRGGEPLAVTLKAAGLDGPTATRVILFSGDTDMRDYFAVKRLVDLYDAVSMRSALLLVSRWRADAGPLPARSPRHLPQTDAGTPVRARDGQGHPTRADAPPLVRRDRA